MNKQQTIKLNSDYIRNHLNETKQSRRNLSQKMGFDNPNYISAILHEGKMPAPNFKLMCILTGMDEEKATYTEPKKVEPETPSGEPDITKTMNENTELLVSYMQDLGKIHTELLREIKELKDIVGHGFEGTKDVLDSIKVQEHADSEKSLNYFKYGRK